MQLKLKNHNLQGKLITFCGLDGSGKTTMIKKLTEKLEENGINPILTKQPTKAMRKTDIFRNFMDCENHSQYAYRALSLMAAADRIQHTELEIEPEMEKGNWVISDRYFYSCLANLRARGYTKDQWIYEIGEQIIKPTISIFMDIPVEVAVERVRQRPEEKERYIDMELQYRLREEYLRIAEDVGGVVVSSKQTEETCFEQIWKKVIDVCVLKNENGDADKSVISLLSKYASWDGKIQSDMDVDADLGLDSLRRTQFICDLESVFGFEFRIEDLNPDKWIYVGDICRLVRQYVG